MLHRLPFSHTMRPYVLKMRPSFVWRRPYDLYTRPSLACGRPYRPLFAYLRMQTPLWTSQASEVPLVSGAPLMRLSAPFFVDWLRPWTIVQYLEGGIKLRYKKKTASELVVWLRRYERGKGVATAGRP